MGLFQFLSSLFGGNDGGMTVAEPEAFEAFEAEPSADDAVVSAQSPGGASWWVPRGEPVLVASPDEGDRRLVDQGLYKAFGAALNDSELELPRLPEAARRALMMLNDPGVNFARLAEPISFDPAIAAAVLRKANSAHYGGHTRIARVELACTRLGTRTLRALVLAESTKGLLIRFGRGERGSTLWRRALVSAVTLEVFADPARKSAEEAFLLGLLHDIGSLAVLKVVHEFEKRTKQTVSDTLFRGVCRKWHEHIGLRLAESWNLPDPLPEIIGTHHRALRADDPLDYERTLIQFVAVVRALLEYDPYVPYDFFNLPCVRNLGLTASPETLSKLAELPSTLRRRISIA